MSVPVVLAEALYPQECFERALDAYRAFCKVRVIEVSGTKYCIEIQAVPGINEKQVTQAFLNYLLDISVEKHLKRI